MTQTDEWRESIVDLCEKGISVSSISKVFSLAGTTALVYYDCDMPSYEFCERMYRETGAFVTLGDCFEQPHSVRVGYASDTQVLKDGLSAFLRTLEQK